jgi:hypothetical protein
MGNYNPDSPVIVGQEWVGIRDENLTLSRASNTVEVGHRLVLPAARTLASAQFYVDKQPDGFVNGQVIQVALYPAGLEDSSGPLRKLYVPCTAGNRSGGATINAPATTVPQALQNPSSPGITYSTVNGEVDIYFDFTPYAQQLQGKRIMSMSVIYSMRANGVDAYGGGGLLLSLLDNFADLMFYGYITGEVGTTALTTHRVPLGEVNPFWANTTAITTNECLPFTLEQLLRMVSTATHPFFLTIIGQSASSINDIVLQSVQLEVVYCEEQRIAYGGCRYDNGPPNFNNNFNTGANVIPMHAAVTLANNPVIPAGVYSVVVSSPTMGDYTSTDSVVDVVPELNQVRQFYGLDPQRGVQVNIPFPPWDNVGQTFTQETTVKLLPQISLHASGSGVFPEVHVYGRRAAAPVYGNIITSQGIDATAVPSATFPQARYYARRFGDTVTPLSLSQGSFAATITPAQFDALPEIVDGWKEVNVRLSSAPTGAQISSAGWNWSATGETVGNRWEVLGVSAPAVSGIPGNLLNQVPSLQRLSSATYLAPSGSAMALTWQSPQVSGAALDVTSDAVLLFSQDPPTVSGIGVVTASQAVTGLGVLCAPSNQPMSVPTGITYNQVSWTPPVGAAFDAFGRNVAPGGWGNADVGGAWTTVGGSASDYSVTGGSGVMTHTNVNVTRRAVLGTAYADGTVTALITTSVAATGGPVYGRIYARYVDTSNHYYGEIKFNTTGTVSASIAKVVAGVTTTLATASFVGTYVAGTGFYGKLLVQGSMLSFTVWPNGANPPGQPTIVTADSALTSGVAGLGSLLDATNTNTLPVTVLFDNFSVSLATIQYVELQRSDTVDPTWYPIMRNTLQSATGFADYEARIGILTSYRVRLVNVLGFVGSWSATVTSTITAPGVIGRRVDNSVLVFTSNYAQSGIYNLAYAESWDGTPSEDFTFPESGRSRLQWLYGRDFMAAYRPTERGGEQFSRGILIQNAAIASGPVLRAAAQSLRDMGWADLPYVCVRNELGDRWFANVVVPSIRIQRNRSLQVAQVAVTEITATPYAVNPGA